MKKWFGFVAVGLLFCLPAMSFAQTSTDRSELDQFLKDTQNQGDLPVGTKITMQNWEQYKAFMPFGMTVLFEGKYYWKMPADVEIDVGPTRSGIHGAIGSFFGRVNRGGFSALRTLVGIMQNSLIQDANEGGAAAKMLRIVTIDIRSGSVTHQFAYLLTTGTGVSEIVALNDHELLVDERDGHGRANGDNAKAKQLFKIDLTNAVDVTNMDGLTAAANAVPKTLFLDIVQLLTANGIAAGNIPAKIEGLAFGDDMKSGSTKFHTLWIANDNDFLQTVADANGNQIPNPNQFFVVGFTDADLDGSIFVPQPIKPLF